MKKHLLLFTIMGLALSMVAQTTKTLNLPMAGTLSTSLTTGELSSVTNLTLIGSIDACGIKNSILKSTLINNTLV